MALKWYEKHALRLKAEAVIMDDRFPQFVLKKRRRELFWEGILETNFGTFYLVNIIYPPNYPYQRPGFRIIEPKLRSGCPHRFLDGSLCVFPDKWDHKKCTAPAGVPLMASWLAMYEIWLRTGERW